MNRDRLWELLAKKETNQITLAELKELKEILNQNPEFEKLVPLVTDIFATKINFDDVTNEDISRSYSNIGKKIKKAESRSFLKKSPVLWKIAVAASLLSLLTIAFFMFRNPKENFVAMQHIVTKPGMTCLIILPDSSRVRLNSNSSLFFPKIFNKELREVQLSGEAYFEVSRDEKRPLIVHTKNMDVEVLGTTFNVRAFENEFSTQAILLEGLINIILPERFGKIVLKPNEKFEIENISRKVSISNIGDSSTIPKKEIARENNTLSFQYRKFSDIAIDLEKKYGVKVFFKNTSVKNKKFSGNFINNNLTEIIKALSIAGDFKYEIKGKAITIK